MKNAYNAIKKWCIIGGNWKDSNFTDILHKSKIKRIYNKDSKKYEKVTEGLSDQEKQYARFMANLLADLIVNEKLAPFNDDDGKKIQKDSQPKINKLAYDKNKKYLNINGIWKLLPIHIQSLINSADFENKDVFNRMRDREIINNMTDEEGNAIDIRPLIES